MKIGTLVKHIEHEYIGILVKKGVGLDDDSWLVHWNYEHANGCWYSECEMEVINEKR